MTTAVQHSFGGGELSPTLYSRVDSQKYAQGCKTLRNNIITRSGAMMNRPGTTFCGEVKDSTKTVRPIPFQFSNDQAYMLEFGDLYVRFYQNGNQVLETPTTITGITNDNPGVITDIAHGYVSGDEVYISGIFGTTQLNGGNYKVVYIGADSYSLQYMDGSVVDTTAMTAYSLGGTAQRVYTIVSPYPYTALPGLDFAQSGDIITITHPDYPIQQLSRTGNIANGLNVWTFTSMSLNPNTASPTNGSTVAQGDIQACGFKYWTQGILPDKGVFFLQWKSTVVGPLNYNASTSTIQSSVDALVGSNLCTVASQMNSNLQPLTFSFINGDAGVQQPPILVLSYMQNAVSGSLTLTTPTVYLQVGGPSTGASGSYTFKYQTTAVDKVTGEESLPCLNGSISVSAVTTRGMNGTICQVTTGSVHGLSSGDEVAFSNMTAAGVPELNVGRFSVTVLDTSNFILNNVDSTTFGVYSSGATMQTTIITAANKATPTPAQPITVNPGGVGSNIGLINVYKQINGIYGYIGSVSPGKNFFDTNAPPDTTLQPPQFNNLFSTANNFPSCVIYFQQRLCFANTYTLPNGFWASKVGMFNNFNQASPGVPVADDDAVIFQLATTKIDPIVNMANIGNLVLLTQNSEYAVLGNNTGGQYGTLTPTAINATMQSYNGSAPLKPVVIDGSLIYLQARQSILRDLLFHFEEDKYKGNDLSVFASHLFDQYSIVSMDYQQIPNTMLWCVRSDGTMLTCTHNKEQQILAWAHHDTSGTFENVCVIPEGGTDYVYCVVNRKVITNGTTRNARYVERFNSRIVEIPDITKSVFMDSAGIYNGNNDTTVTNVNGTETDLLLNGGWGSVPSNTAFNASNPTQITVRGWIKLNANNYNSGLMARCASTGDLGDWAVGFFTGNSNQLMFRVNQGAAAIMSPVISKNIWHFVECSYDSNAGLMRMFIDGVLVQSGGYSTVITNHSNQIMIGNYYDSTANYTFKGEMSEWEFCANYIRNTSNYTPPSVISPDTNTTLCYHMNDGTGKTLADSSSNSLNASLTGITFLGPIGMTLSGGTTWSKTEQLTLTSNSSYFHITMIGDDIRTTTANGNPIIFKILAYNGPSQVTVQSNIDVPVNLRNTAFINWGRGTSNITGLWWLENHAVSVLGDGYVVASPYNAKYNKNNGLLVVRNGSIQLPNNHAYVIVGCPYISDLKTLDVDVVGYAVFMGKTAMDKWKNISQVTSQMVQTRGGFYGSATPETEYANLATLNPLYKLNEIKSRNIGTNPSLPPELITDNIRLTIEGGWDIHGNVFVRQVDPLPMCISAIAFAGNIPLREQEVPPQQQGRQ